MNYISVLGLALLAFMFGACPSSQTDTNDNSSETNDNDVESPGVYVEELPSGIHTIRAVETSTLALIGNTERTSEDRIIRSLVDYENHFGSAIPSLFLYESVKLFFENGGKSCMIFSSGEGETISEEAILDALERSRRAEVQLVSIPDVVVLEPASFYRVQNRLSNSCALLKDRFALLNTLPSQENALTDFADFRSNSSSSDLSYSAVYYPYLVTSDGRKVPPSGAIAGIYSRVDEARGVWKAPANEVIYGITGFAQNLTDAEQDVANVDASGKSINILRSFTGRGNVVWGARTLAGNDNEWRYVPVRRLAIQIETSLLKGSNWAVFEPNDEPLWNNLNSSFSVFMETMYRQGAFQGSRQEQAYFVKVGLNETMTQTDVDEDRLIYEVGFAPLRPAEFIILRNTRQLR